ncbi:hypothetical protein ACO0LM_00785 [Undibacterium sp. Di26W]|uniref:hypothetical protein n=1 Tax=Undibacterium sp. Di26W TaxID=3413035 RepID=UPI003BF15B2A
MTLSAQQLVALLQPLQQQGMTASQAAQSLFSKAASGGLGAPVGLLDSAFLAQALVIVFDTFTPAMLAAILHLLYPQLSALDVGKEILQPNVFPNTTEVVMQSALTAAGFDAAAVADAIQVLYDAPPHIVGLPIQASDVWAGSAPNVGMILSEPVSTACILTTFNVMLSSVGGGVSGAPVAIVCDRAVDGEGKTIFTVTQTSAVVGLDPAVYTTQNLALHTPLTIQPGQVAGFVNSGPQNFAVNWIDGPPHHVFWPAITAVHGFTVTILSGDAGTPVVSCGWNFTAAPVS